MVYIFKKLNEAIKKKRSIKKKNNEYYILSIPYFII